MEAEYLKFTHLRDPVAIYEEVGQGPRMVAVSRSLMVRLQLWTPHVCDSPAAIRFKARRLSLELLYSRLGNKFT